MPVYKPEVPELVREIDKRAHHPSLSHLKPFKLVYVRMWTSRYVLFLGYFPNKFSCTKISNQLDQEN